MVMSFETFETLKAIETLGSCCFVLGNNCLIKFETCGTAFSQAEALVSF